MADLSCFFNIIVTFPGLGSLFCNCKMYNVMNLMTQCMIFYVLMLLKITLLSSVMISCSVVGGYRCFRLTYCLGPQEISKTSWESGWL